MNVHRVFHYRRFVHRAARREAERNKLDTAKHERSCAVNVVVVVVSTRICIREGRTKSTSIRRCVIGGSGSIDSSGASIRTQNSDSVVSDVCSTQRWFIFRRGVLSTTFWGGVVVTCSLIWWGTLVPQCQTLERPHKVERRVRRDESVRRKRSALSRREPCLASRTTSLCLPSPCPQSTISRVFSFLFAVCPGSWIGPWIGPGSD